MSGWASVAFEDACTDISGGNQKVPKSRFAESGAFPIVDQGEKEIAGFTNDADLLFKGRTPVIVFGDHTRRFKFVDYRFAVGADGVKVLRPKGDFDPRYLFQYLRTVNIPSAGYSRHFKFLRNITVPLPPLNEQRRIARVLGAANGLRTKRRRAALLVESLIASSYVQRFADPQATKSPWPRVALGDLTRIIRGASPRPAGDPRFFGGNIPWLKISDISAARGRYVTHIKEGVTEEGMAKSVFVDAGSLILTNSATVGIPKFLGHGSCIHDGFLALLDLDSDRVHPIYLYANLVLRRVQIVGLALTGTQKNLNTGIVKELAIALPPIASQQSFAAEMEVIERVSDVQAQHLAHLDALFASLQSRAFSDQL